MPLKGKRVTGFTNGEEQEMHLTNVVPFLVEDELMRLGATFEKRADWQPLSIIDGRLITRQNPASSPLATQNFVNLLAASVQPFVGSSTRRVRGTPDVIKPH
jgi:putative intracellular protease/amidase